MRKKPELPIVANMKLKLFGSTKHVSDTLAIWDFEIPFRPPALLFQANPRADLRRKATSKINV